MSSFFHTKYLIAENRRSLTPQLFEALLFLKFKECFWNAHLVSDAVDGARPARVEARIKAHELEQENLSSFEDWNLCS